jgi:hypothetical protein
VREWACVQPPNGGAKTSARSVCSNTFCSSYQQCGSPGLVYREITDSTLDLSVGLAWKKGKSNPITKNSGLEAMFDPALSTDAVRTYRPDPSAYQLGRHIAELLLVGWQCRLW